MYIQESQQCRNLEVRDFSYSSDFEAVVEADLKAFETVYRTQFESEDDARLHLKDAFNRRFDILPDYWTQVAVNNGKIAGFMTVCPTEHKPEDFQSWEETTNNGTLDGTYNENGEYLYIVTLSKAHPINGLEDRLCVRQIGNMVSERKKLAYFEARMPKFLRYATRYARDHGIKVKDIDDETLHTLATEYVKPDETTGKYRDPVLQTMLGDWKSELVKVVPGAYSDPLSLNYGALCQFENPIIKAPKSVSKLAGFALRLSGNSQKATNFIMNKI